MRQAVAVRAQDHYVFHFGAPLPLGNRVEVMHVKLRINHRHETTLHALTAIVFQRSAAEVLPLLRELLKQHL